MVLFKNAVHALVITAAFYAGSFFIEGVGIDFLKDAIVSPIGMVVAFLLAFMETTYNRF